MPKRKILKFLLAVTVIVTVVLGFYLYKLHALAAEGNNIFEQRCLKVNPPLIAYKNSFLKVADLLKSKGEYSADEIKGFFDDYLSGMRQYVEEENKWLEIQGKFIDRWDFKLIEPWYLKLAGEYQLKMYEGYRDDAKYILEMYDQEKSSEELEAKQIEARDRRNQYAQLYYDLFEKAVEIEDWRKFFGRVPIPKGCNKENITIPETAGSLDSLNEAPSFNPGFAPINPDTTS